MATRKRFVVATGIKISLSNWHEAGRSISKTPDRKPLQI